MTKFRMLSGTSFMTSLVFGSVLTLTPGLAQSPAPQIILPDFSTAVQSQQAGGASEPVIDVLINQTPADLNNGQLPSSGLVQRDRNVGENAGQSTRILSLAPLRKDLKMGVEMGASFSEPGILRLTGEVAQIDLGMMLPEGIALPEHLVISRRSSVNVNDELAKMEVQINDAPVQTVALDMLTGFRQIKLPTEGLRPGQNVISLKLQQPHRIFCGPDASFGTWTEIDLRQSGLPLPVGTLSVDAKGFATALRAQVAAGIATNLLFDENTHSDVIRGVSDQLAPALGDRAPFSLRSFYNIRTPSDASVAVIKADRESVSYRRGARGGLVLNIEVVDDKVPDLSAIVEELKQYGSLQTDAQDAALPLGVAVPLSDLGMPDTIANTHFFQEKLDFALPNNWLLLANQRAKLELNYGFASNLAKGSRLLVKVNDEVVRLLPLDEGGGRILPTLDVIFPANLLHGGLNNLTFEMVVPGAPADEACALRHEDMLVILASSTLTVPPAPAMVLPGLAQSLTGLEPQSIVAVELPGKAESAGLSSEQNLKHLALELASRLKRPEEPNPDASLTVVGLSGLGAVPLGAIGLQARDIQLALLPRQSRALTQSPAAPVAAVAPAQGYSLQDPSETAVAPVAENDVSIFGDLFDYSGVYDWGSEKVEGFVSQAFLGSKKSLKEWLTGQNAVAVLLRPDLSNPDALWLVVGPNVNVDQLSQALDHLSVSHLARGEAAILPLNSDVWKVWQPVRPLMLRESLNLSNLRTILGNYASWSPILFSGVVLILTAISILPALLYVVLSRRRRTGV